ncbi:Thermostable hemolysin [Tistlia consotensis]|uniref:Thermostable hemolysin n=1 Tax=Tistlia consotensis USBA 355 TaxID=560819 RepID=A0A1Y6CMI5_9PROT|nr:thermostable hemolysin [Tistlia consotensis]SMF60140.1 Thermostable hemolysin [Tistlia consotensis USBA 355]SNR93802.1 Thermostable hemolysin [Tistlia consotensis]
MLCDCVPFAPAGPTRDLVPDRPGPAVSRTEPAPGGDPRGGLLLVPASHPLREAVEDCIATVYERAFGARDLSFPTLLIAWAGADGRPLCAAGLRTAADGFFSEAYLDRPIERLLAAEAGEPVAREAVFEVTTLASRSAEASPAFLRQLAVFGGRAGFRWSFFTATERLRRLLRGLGIPALELAPADPGRLADPERWGSYYSQAPRVCAVRDGWLEGGVLVRGAAGDA